MKNLAILAIVTCFASTSNAQFLHVATADSLTKITNIQQDVILNIPMLGNVVVKETSYAFQEATMLFQIEASELNLAEKQSVDTITVPASYSIRQKEDTLTANNKERRL